MALANKVIYQNGAIKRFEKPEVCKAIKVANANRWTVALSPTEWDQREARLKYEYEKNTKSPVPGEDHPVEKSSSVPHTGLVYDQNFEVERLRQENKDLLKVIEKMEKGNPALKEASSQFNDALLDEQAKKIDEQNHEITRLLSLVEKKENSISRLHYEKSVLVKENEELKKGEIPARYFDKALVDEQSEKIKKLEHEKLDILEMASSCKQTIAELTKEKTNLEDQITILNACKEYNENVGRKQTKRLGKEVSKLNSIIHDKNAVLSDVAEELRLAKIREENLTEVCQKYLKEIEELREKFADKVVDKIDAQALKSAESALAYKKNVITYKDMALAYYEKKITEKDEVIDDLGKELAATKKKLEEKTKLVETVRKGSKEYCEYGIAAEKMIQKMAKVIVGKSIISSEDFEQYRLWANGYRFNPQLPELSEEELMKIQEKVVASCDIAEEGGDHSGKIVLCGKDFVKKLKENEEAAEELFKVLDDVIEFMSAESKQLFECDGIPTKIEVMKPSRKFKKIK